jgi:hypothetical protein
MLPVSRIKIITNAKDTLSAFKVGTMKMTSMLLRMRHSRKYPDDILCNPWTGYLDEQLGLFYWRFPNLVSKRSILS